MAAPRHLRPVLAALVVVAAVVLAGTDLALAQGLTHANPFGAGAPPPPTGVTGFLLAKQAEFYRLLTAAVRAAKTDGSAFGTLGAISFAYGVFHAAGPGHGKAVISSYLLANEATLKRGAALAFVSAMLQALAAITIAGVLAALIGATAASMTRTVMIIEIAAYGLIVLIGLRLAWVKGRAFAAAWRGTPAHVHGPDCGCADGHVHMPDPTSLPRDDWRSWSAAVLSVGLRPCSGAIVVLVFALAQGIFWVGAASTLLMSLGTALTVTGVAALAVFGKRLAVGLAARGSGRTTALLLRGLEFVAALVLIAFGTALLTGYMVSERLTLG